MLRIAVVLQILPAIVLIVYGLQKQRRWQPYFDMLLMTLPAILFYGIFMRILLEGLFEWYFYFFAALSKNPVIFKLFIIYNQHFYLFCT